MTYEECARCGRKIREGDIRYVVRVTVAGDDGGVLDEEEYSDPDLKIEELIAQMEGKDPQELEDEVYEERMFLLCAPCRKAFMKNPFGFRSEDAGEDETLGPVQ